jgi:hypothetical protein
VGSSKEAEINGPENDPSQGGQEVGSASQSSKGCSAGHQARDFSDGLIIECLI